MDDPWCLRSERDGWGGEWWLFGGWKGGATIAIAVVVVRREGGEK